MVNSFISMCSRIWNQGRRLLRTVWDYVSEHIIPILKDAIDCLSAQRDSIIHYAIPGSAVEGHDIYYTSQNDASKLENGAAYCSSKLWIDHSKSENALSWTPRQQSALDMDNGSSSHIPRASSSIYDDDDQQDDEPLGAKTPRPHQFSHVYQLYPELYGDQQDDEPLVVDSREARQLFSGHRFQYKSYHPLQSASKMGIPCPKPIRIYPTHKVILEPTVFEDWYVDMSETIDHEEFSSELFEDCLLNTSQSICLDPEHSSKTPAGPLELGTGFPARKGTPYPKFGDNDKDNDESVEADSPTLPRPIPPKKRQDTPYPGFGDDEKDDKSIEADGSELGRLFPGFN